MKSYFQKICNALNYTSSQNEFEVLDIRYKSKDLQRIKQLMYITLFEDLHYQIADVAYNCYDICTLLYQKLAGEPLLLTGGNILINNEISYNTTTKYLKELYARNNNIQSPMHVWFTLGEYIIDPTILSTLLYCKEINTYKLIDDDILRSNYLIAHTSIHGSIQYFSKIKLSYDPLIIGERYFLETGFIKKSIEL